MQILNTSNLSDVDEREIVKAFLESRRTKSTRLNYERDFKVVLNSDPAGFLKLARNDAFRAKLYLINWISANKGRLSGASIRNYFIGIKSLCDTAEIYLPWKNIYNTMPAANTADEKAPPIEAVRKLYRALGKDLRMQVALGILFSGCRLGAFDYLKLGDISEITVKDETNLPVTFGRVIIYQGEPEEYVSFLTPETMENIHVYKMTREAWGETLSPRSPVVRKYFTRISKKAPERTTSVNLQSLLKLWWSRIGYPTGVRDWAMVHGFRKFAETQLCNNGMKYEDAELILGHRLRYYKATEDHLAKEFVRAMPALYISREPELEARIKRKELEHNEEASKWYVQSKRNEDRLAEEVGRREKLEAKVNPILDVISRHPEIIERLKDYPD